MILVTVSDMVQKLLHACKFGMLKLPMNVLYCNFFGFLMFHLHFFLDFVGYLQSKAAKYHIFQLMLIYL